MTVSFNLFPYSYFFSLGGPAPCGRRRAFRFTSLRSCSLQSLPRSLPLPAARRQNDRTCRWVCRGRTGRVNCRSFLFAQFSDHSTIFHLFISSSFHLFISSSHPPTSKRQASMRTRAAHLPLHKLLRENTAVALHFHLVPSGRQGAEVERGGIFLL